MTETPTESNNGDASTSPRCVLDRSILNEQTISDLQDIGLSFFASLCGRNRGAFILDPPDGNTYGCLDFPSNIKDLAGVTSSAQISQANDIKDAYTTGSTTGADTVELLDLLVKSVYQSSPNVDKDPYACNAGGLAMLECNSSALPRTMGWDKIRSATLTGVFVPAPWATGGKALTIDQAKSFYTEDDFADMVQVGVNTVQIPVPLQAFDTNAGDGDVIIALGDLLQLASSAGLQAIIDLSQDSSKRGQYSTEGKENGVAVKAAARFAFENNVLALTLPSMDASVIQAARAAAGPDLILFLPLNEGDLSDLQVPDDKVFAALDMGHTNTIADVASSTSLDDRNKMFYHEATSCISRSPIDFTFCYKNVPVFISNGFDLAIENCILEGTALFQDYGQCGRFDETIDSPWWKRHRMSFAKRQLFSFERSLGWSFSAWKLYGDDGHPDGVIDTPRKLHTLKNVVAAGLMPSLKEKNPAPLACLNPPDADFVLGDDTLSPTPGPPPDCGNGWWDFDLKKCTYWVPPACEDGGWWDFDLAGCVYPPTSTPTVAPFPATFSPTPIPCPTPLGNKALAIAALSGGAAVLFVGAAIRKIRAGGGYETIAN